MLVGVSTFWQIAIKGAVIILAVMLDQAQQRIKRSKNAALAAADKHQRARPAGRDHLTPRLARPPDGRAPENTPSIER